jgi:hypothetical protein
MTSDYWQLLGTNQMFRRTLRRGFVFRQNDDVVGHAHRRMALRQAPLALHLQPRCGHHLRPLLQILRHRRAEFFRRCGARLRALAG